MNTLDKRAAGMDYQRITHPFRPIFDEESRVLILGTLPSVKSRENDFYYGHPQNRFWKLMARLLEEPLPVTREEKTALLLRHGIALWDVVQSCEICGSSDSSIRNVEPTKLQRILGTAQITRIYANGGKAAELYRRFQLPATGIPAVTLPSTSPANAAWTMERLLEAWQQII